MQSVESFTQEIYVVVYGKRPSCLSLGETASEFFSYARLRQGVE